MIEVTLFGNLLTFETENTLFSPSDLDRGTRAMLSTIELKPGMKALDLGCGWGAVGTALARVCGGENVCFLDRDETALRVARANAERNGIFNAHFTCSNGFDHISEGDFDLILSNPPYQSDFSVAKGFIEQGYRHLKDGGALVLVVKRKLWYKNKMISVFGGVKIAEIDGYFVLRSEKRPRICKLNEQRV